MKRMKLTLAFTLLLLLAGSVAITPLSGAAQIQGVRDATQAFIKETTFLASAARTASGDSTTVVDVSAYSAGNIYIDVTAVSGTSPSLTVIFQSCPTTTVADCQDHTTGTAITATGKQLLKVNNFGRYALIKFTISGTTPSFTFSVKGAFKPTT